MEYHAKSQKIYLLGKGHVWQSGDEFTGNKIEYAIGNESAFRYELNDDPMATEKLSHGIRSFVADQVKLESWLKEFK
jgi:transaldolase